MEGCADIMASFPFRNQILLIKRPIIVYRHFSTVGLIFSTKPNENLKREMGATIMTVLETERSRALELLDRFKDVHKTEVSFYLVFSRFNQEDLSCLKVYFNEENQWKVFNLICMHHKVKE
jgi:hypothetical protein